jgi:hypothetical protein
LRGHLAATHWLARGVAIALAATAAGCLDTAPSAPEVKQASTGEVTGLETHVPGDYDWDGDSDLVLQQDTTAFIAFWLTDHFEPYQSHTDTSTPYGPVDVNWRLAASADLNGDDRPDLVFQNRNSQRVVAWHMRDLERISGGFTTPMNDEDPTSQLVCSAYFNDDHQADLVFQSSDPTKRTIVVWVMDPDNPMVRVSRHVVTSAIPGFSVNDFRVAGCGDFSGNGLADLVLRGPAGNVTIAILEDFRAIEQYKITNPTRDWTWTLGAIGELGDPAHPGHFQLIWQHDDNAVEAWAMNYWEYDHTFSLRGPASQPQPWRVVGPR